MEIGKWFKKFVCNCCEVQSFADREKRKWLAQIHSKRGLKDSPDPGLRDAKSQEQGFSC